MVRWLNKNKYTHVLKNVNLGNLYFEGAFVYVHVRGTGK